MEEYTKSLELITKIWKVGKRKIYKGRTQRVKEVYSKDFLVSTRLDLSFTELQLVRADLRRVDKVIITR